MEKSRWCCALVLCSTYSLSQNLAPLNWRQVRERFEQDNPTLLAGKLNVDESKAQEITAFLRPNPNLGFVGDQINPFDGGPAHSTFGSLLTVASASYLLERQHKRELRRESAQQGTDIARSSQSDLERNLLFSLRGAFVQTLQAHAVLAVAKENLAYY